MNVPPLKKKRKNLVNHMPLKVRLVTLLPSWARWMKGRERGSVCLREEEGGQLCSCVELLVLTPTRIC